MIKVISAIPGFGCIYDLLFLVYFYHYNNIFIKYYEVTLSP